MKEAFKKKLLVGLLTVISVFTFIGCSNAKDESKTTSSMVVEDGNLKVGLCAAYPPFESRNEKTGEIEGFDVELAKALGEELGLKVEIIDAEWSALLGGVVNGDYDTLITCMSKKEASKENVNMSDAYYNLNDVIAVNKDNTSMKSIDDLKDKVVGVQLGSGSEQALDKMEGLKEIKRYNYNPEAFIDLENNRIDAVAVGYAYALNQIKKDNSFKVLEKPIDSAEIVMIQKHGNDELTKKLNEALAKIKENGKYDEILNKWLKF